jgi:hypothetical protein
MLKEIRSAFVKLLYLVQWHLKLKQIRPNPIFGVIRWEKNLLIKIIKILVLYLCVKNVNGQAALKIY